MDVTQLQKFLENGCFTDQDHEKYCCCMCHMFLVNFRRMHCKHIFCNTCIGVLSNKGDDKIMCPFDGAWNFKDQIPEDNCTEELLQMEITCVNRKLGCCHRGTLFDVQKHVLGCEFTPVKCPQGCKQDIPKAAILLHLKEQCPCRHETCQFCQQTIPFSRMEDHRNDCSLLLLQCPNQCGIQGMSRELMKKHILTCDEGIISCRYETLGCRFRGTNKKLAQHERDFQHHMDVLMQFTMNETIKFQSQAVRLQAKISELQNENIMLKNNIVQNNDFIDAIKGHVDVLSRKTIEIQKKVNKQDKASYRENNVKDCEIQIQECNTNNKLSPIDVVPGQHFEILVNQLKELDNRLKTMEKISYDGTLLWEINNFGQYQNNTYYLDSIPFYTSRCGYKIQLRLFLNGTDTGEGTHLSLYIQLQKSPIDNCLSWPFQHKVTLMLLDQLDGKRHVTFSFRPNPLSPSCQKPIKEANDSIGSHQFISLEELFSSDIYLVNDKIFIKAIVSDDI